MEDHMDKWVVKFREKQYFAHFVLNLAHARSNKNEINS